MEIRCYEPGDEEAIGALFELTYGRPLAPDYWRWRFRDAPDGPGIIFLAWDASTLAAHYAVTPVQLQVGGELVPTGLSGTTMTHPDYRGQRLFPKLADATYRAMAEQGMAAVWGFPNANSHRGFIEHLEWNDVVEIPTMEANASEVPARGVSGPTETPINEALSTGDWPARGSAVQVARSAAYLRWRYVDNPAETYRAVTFGSAAVVFKRYKDSLQVVDSTGEPDDIASCVEMVARIATQEGAQRVNLWAPLPSALHRLLERRRFGPTSPVTYLGYRALSSAGDALADPLAWHFAMGDSDVY